MLKVVGFEAANSYVKSRSAKGAYCYLNTIRPRADHEEAVNIKSQVKVTDQTKPEDMVFKYNGLKYTVGDPLYSLSSTARDVDRYSSSFYKIASILAIAMHAENGDKIKAVTGVPANHYQNEDVNKTIVEQLKGTHTVVVNGETRVFEIVEVKVILQPMGTIYSLIVNDDGTYTDHGQAIQEARRKAVVDIGFGSTDVAILDGMTLLRKFTVDVSMVDVYKFVLEKFDLLSKIELLEAEQILRRTDTILFGGRSYHAGEALKQGREFIAEQIMTKVKAKEALHDFDFAIFTGGGVEALYEPLKPHLVNVANAVKVGNAQGANAEGYYLYGLFA